tara:strand:+ start:1563 stop:2672 length:1110 start_codon:yes stop_codon:yes gene_type:complete
MWKTVKLGDVCDFQNGFAFKSALFKESGSPILRISNIQNEKIDVRKTVFFDAKDYDTDFTRYEVKRDDLVIAMSGATTGKIGFNKIDTTYYLNQRVGNLKPKPVLDKVFLYYLLSTKVQENLSISKGAAQPNLSSEQIKNIGFSLPPLEEQKRIVAKLDAAFAKIESLNKIVSTRKAELAKLKKALLLKTLSSEKSDLINLGDVCELIYGKGLDKIDRLENDGIPAYGANGIKTYSTKILSDEPSIIIGRKGSAGELTRVSVAFWALDVTYYTKINKKLIDLDFLYYTLSSMDLPSMAKGVKPGINRNDVYKRLIYLPTLEEQKYIVSILDAAYTEIEKVNDSVSKLKNNCDALKTAILKQELQPSEAA